MHECALAAQPSLTLCQALYRTVARKGPLSLGLFRQEHWSGLPFPPPGNLSHVGIDPLGGIFIF